MKNDKIAVTFGNPNGIGPEICAKSLQNFPPDKRRRFILVGDNFSYTRYFKGLKDIPFVRIDPPEGLSFLFSPGIKDVQSGAMSWLFLKRAVMMVKDGDAGAIVTAPISKDLIVRSGHPEFTDHTTFLAREFGVKRVSMMFFSDDLKVILATIHISLKNVPGQITGDSVRTALDNALLFGKKYEGKSYRIAVCGLNPHAGENGLLGSEDMEVISPVVNEYRDAGLCVEGPIPADTAFYRAFRKEFDCVAAMYHDQGLAPFKLLHFDDGVNVTLGLPLIRTSPDHGTAFDIAGKGVADGKSMEKALELSLKLLDG